MGFARRIGAIRPPEGAPAWTYAGLAVWAILLAVILAMTWRDPERRSVVTGYLAAARQFWAGEPIYRPEVSAGFLYTPAFAAAFAPLAALGSPLADISWRLLQTGILLYATARYAARLSQSAGGGAAILGAALLVAAPGSASALQNGQATVLLLAATLLAFDAAHDRRWIAAAAWATAAVLAKPLGIVVWLLIAAVRWRSIPWLLAFLALLLALPYALQQADYVTGLYRQFIAVLANIAPERPDALWNDLMAIPRQLGIPVNPLASFSLRAAAALATLALVWRACASRRYAVGALGPAILACAYMLLFNPRAESNTYIMMAVPMALAAAYALLETRDRRLGWTLIALTVPLGLVGISKPTLALFNPWLKPTLLILALACLAAFYSRIARRPAAAPSQPATSAPNQ